MSDYSVIKDDIKNAIVGKAPFVVLDTAERSRARALLKEVAGLVKREIDFYTDSHQFCGLLDINRRYSSGGSAYDFIEEQLKKNQGLVFALADPKYIDSDNPYNRKLIDLIYLAAAGGSTIIVVTADNIWSRLSSLGIYCKLGLPTLEERTAQIKSFVDRFCKNRLTSEEINNAAMLLSGFSQLQLEIMISQAHVSKEGLSYESLLQISKKKSTVYGKNTSVTQIFPERDIEVAGLERLKDWLKRKKTVFFTHSDLLKKHDLKAPRGILLGGVPGCGKSLSAKMVAMSWELPLYRFDLAAVFDKYVGESEKNMRLALEYVDNVSPCVLWADEVEKMFASGEGSDTARRLLGQFLFWLQESSSRIFLVATANNVSLLPPELFRKGRISEVFFLGLPKRAERRATIKLYTARSLHMELSREQMQELEDLSEGFSFADIENAIKDTAEMLLERGDMSESEIFMELKRTFGLSVPISKSSPTIVQNITQWGHDCATNAAGGED